MKITLLRLFIYSTHNVTTNRHLTYWCVLIYGYIGWEFIVLIRICGTQILNFLLQILDASISVIFVAIPAVLLLIMFEHVNIFLIHMLKYPARKYELLVIFDLFSSLNSDFLTVRLSPAWSSMCSTTTSPTTMVFMTSYLNRTIPFTNLFFPNPRPHLRPCLDGVLHMTCWILRLVCVVVVEIGGNLLFISVLNELRACLYVMIIIISVNINKIQTLIRFSHSHLTSSSIVGNSISYEWTTPPSCFT